MGKRRRLVTRVVVVLRSGPAAWAEDVGHVWFYA
jgi:hypothetical protein